MDKKVKILVVSESETTKRIIEFWLSTLFVPKNILIAKNFFQAWMTLMDNKVDMVITDMIDGTQLAIEMNRENRTCLIPVIFCPCFGLFTGESDIAKIPQRTKSLFMQSVKICMDSIKK